MGELAVSLLAAISTGLFCYASISMYRSTVSSGMMEEIIASREKPMFLRMFLPLARLLGNFAVSLFVEPEASQELDGHPQGAVGRIQNQLARRLVAAGSPWGILPNELIGLTLISGIVGGLTGLYLGMLTGYGPVLGSFPCAFLGLYLPMLWLHDLKNTRQIQVVKSLPYVLDLLTLAVEAGLDFTVAISRIVTKVEGTAIGEEFSRVLQEINLGKNRSQALRDLAHRVDMPEVTSMSSAIVQANELGSSLGPVLRIQSQQVRERRSQRAEKLAMEAPVKIIFPLVFFIFPTTLIILFGSIGLRLWYGG